MKSWLLAGIATALLATCGCQTSHTIKVEPVEIKPIHITMDVNVNVKVDRQLDNFFGDVDAARQAEETKKP